MIDAAHGGSDPGALLTPSTAEKEVTLIIARRLRQELQNRGMNCQLLRDGDFTLSADQRATSINSALPSLYISIHASSVGNGLRVFTALLPVSQGDHGPFADWQTAQSSALSRSKSIQQQFTAAVQKMGFPVRALEAPLRPLNNVKVPALAIEIAPTTGDVSQLAAQNYQQLIGAAIANALAPVSGALGVSGAQP